MVVSICALIVSGEDSPKGRLYKKRFMNLLHQLIQITRVWPWAWTMSRASLHRETMSLATLVLVDGGRGAKQETVNVS